MISEMEGVAWIHPDGFWHPNMDQRETTFNAIKLTVADYQQANIVVIDNQFRHQFMLDIFDEDGVTTSKQILLYYTTADRRHRLEEWSWSNAI